MTRYPVPSKVQKAGKRLNEARLAFDNMAEPINNAFLEILINVTKGTDEWTPKQADQFEQTVNAISADLEAFVSRYRCLVDEVKQLKAENKSLTHVLST